MLLEDALRSGVVSADDVGRLLSATNRLSAVRSLDDLLAIVRTAARQLSGADGVTVVLRDGEQVYYVDENSISPLWKGQRFPAAACISGWAMLHKRAAVIEDIYEDARVPHDAYRPTFVRSLVMTPIGVDDPVGAIGAYWAAVRAPSDREVALLAALAHASAIAFVNLELIQHLTRTREAAEAVSRGKDEFFAMLGHELRNPLAPITTALDLIGLRGELGKIRELAIIDRQARHLAHLVDELLDASQVTAGQIELDRQPLEVAEILERAIEMAMPLIERRRHRLERAAAPARLRITGDATRLTQSVNNLLINAAKYTAPGGLIVVAIERDAGDAVIRVRDTGNGIPAELLPRLFGVFVQGARRLDRSEGGLGLGLAMVRAIVEQHGGRASAHSDGPGHGSEFVIRIPALETAGDAPIHRAGDPAAHGAGDVPAVLGDPRRVLIVDDNVDAAEMLMLLLRDVGHIVETAHDGPQALELAPTFKPDVAILDLGLPAMDGYELAERLRALLPHDSPTLIAVTGYGQDHDRARTRTAGFDAHLVKPVDVRQLVDAIIRYRAS